LNTNCKIVFLLI